MRINLHIIISIVLISSSQASAGTHQDTGSTHQDTVDVLRGLDLKRVPGTDTLYKVAKKYMGRWAYLFLAVKIEESGNDRHYSWLSTKHFNLCGMRYPRSRKTYSIGSTNSNYAIYRNWFECMLDFKIYMDLIESKYIAKHKKAPATDVDMINFMFNSFNHFAKWKKDMMILIRYVKKKYK